MNDLYIIVILIAIGFAYISTKLTKIIEICSLCVSIQLGKMVAEQMDEETFSLSMKDDEEDE